jgi:hypothetical protein
MVAMSRQQSDKMNPQISTASPVASAAFIAKILLVLAIFFMLPKLVSGGGGSQCFLDRQGGD